MKSNWSLKRLEEVIIFNPSEILKSGTVAKKIAMEKLKPYDKEIKGFEFGIFQSGAKFRNGDTLVAKITPCIENGKTAKVDILEEGEVAFGSTEFIVLRENEKSISDFIFYLAISPIFRKKAISCMEGTSGRKRVNENSLKEQEILFPNIPTQKNIVEILNALDEKISFNNRINTELEQMAKTIYNYWFVQFDFPNEEGKLYKASGGEMEWNEELKREIPVGWEVGIFNEYAEIIGGSTPSTLIEDNFSSNGTAWITPKDLSINEGNKFITKGEVDVSEIGIKSASLKVMPKGTIMLSSRAPIGYIAISRDIVTTNQGFKSFIPREDYFSSFLYYTIKSYIPTFIQKASGSTFKEISAETIKGVLIFLPPVSLIETFSENLKPIFERQNNLELETQELITLRDFLLPLLMNGQVKVK